MYDIVFLSHSETLAETHWEVLRSRFPRARRVHGVDGIVAAHKRAAEVSDTRWFWVVDGDNQVDPEFRFTFKWPAEFRVHDTVTVWRARNNVNGLIYGYGGIKLLPRRRLLELDSGVVDMTTSIGANFRLMPEVASTTIINASPFEAWRSAFRETAKLSSQTIARSIREEDEVRLRTWLNEGEGEHLDQVHRGAREGVEFGEANAGEPERLRLLNDYDWLRQRYEHETDH